MGAPFENDITFSEDFYFIPANLPDIPMADLRKRHSLIATYISRLGRHIASLTVQKRQYDRLKKLRTSHLESTNLCSQKWKFESVCRADEEWVRLDEAVQSLEDKLVVWSAEKEGLELKCSVISREQSRRESEYRVTGG